MHSACIFKPLSSCRDVRAPRIGSSGLHREERDRWVDGCCVGLARLRRGGGGGAAPPPGAPRGFCPPPPARPPRRAGGAGGEGREPKGRRPSSSFSACHVVSRAGGEGGLRRAHSRCPD